MFQQRTKHIEVDCQFFIDIVISKKAIIPYIKSEDQLGDVFTKALGRNLFSIISSNVDLRSIHTST